MEDIEIDGGLSIDIKPKNTKESWGKYEKFQREEYGKQCKE